MKKQLVLIAASVAMSVGAQPLDETTYDVYFQQLSRGGIPDGCMLVFTSVVADTAYLKGDEIVMNGSIAVRSLDSSFLTFTGKLGTRRLLDKSNSWVPPTYFYFSSKSGTTAKAGRVMDGETPGYKLLLAELTPEVLKLLEEMSETGSFTVGFNRKPGGQDVYANVDTTIALKKDEAGKAIRVRNLATRTDFVGCVSSLARSLKK